MTFRHVPVLILALGALAHAHAPRHDAIASFTVSPGSGPPPLAVAVDGSGSIGAHGSIIKWIWDWGDGSPFDSGVTASHTYAATGTYVITLAVKDSGGGAGAASQNVICLTAGNATPSAQITSAGPQVGAVPLTVNFVGQGDDAAPVGDVLEQRWDYGDGSPVDTFTGLASGATTSVSHVYATPGIFHCVLRVKDAEGVWSTAEISINAGSANGPHALFTVTPPSGPPPLDITTDGSASYDPVSSLTSFVWTWDDSTTSTGPVGTHTYTVTGTYRVRLTVTNGSGVSDTTFFDVNCMPDGKLVPSAHILSAVPSSGRAPVAITFLGHAHDDMDNLIHRWDFGDGSPPQVYTGMNNHQNSSPTHVYSIPGTYSCTLRVQDPMNLSAEKSLSVTIETPGSDTLGKHCGSSGAEPVLLFLLIRWIRRRMRHAL